MCGINGIVGTAKTDVGRRVDAMNRALSHRGPDDEGASLFSLANGRWLGLGHRRLSIIDLSASGHQPMLDAGTGHALVFNGEIYNFKALRAILAGKGHVFVSQTDTEVLLRGYAEWGANLVTRLEGMYAFAIYDAIRQRLLLARDPLGIKPLYLCQQQGMLLFASEVRALLQSGVIERRVDRRALAGFLAYGSVQEPLTIQQGVEMISPGTLLQFDLSDLQHPATATKFWSFPQPDRTPPCSRQEAVVQIRELMERSLRTHLVSDVPVGVFLSSGLDSSVLAAFAARRMAGGVHTYTIAMGDDRALDESPLAEETARMIGSTHVAVHLSATDVEKYVRNWFTAVDQPSIDGLNTYIVSAAARECGIKVALSGLGGDELFGGYDHFTTLPRQQRLLQLVAALPPQWRVRMVRALLASRPESIKRKAEDFASINPASILALTLSRRRLFSNRSLQEFGLDAGALGLDEMWMDVQHSASSQLPFLPANDAVSAISMIENLFYMRNTLLRDMDVMGMAHGMELRVPLLDQQLVDFVARLPGEWRTRQHGVSKPLLAEAAGPILGMPEIARRAKMGFSLPLETWMRGTLHESFRVKLALLKDTGWVAPDKVDRIWQYFCTHSTDFGWSRVWALGVLGHLAVEFNQHPES